MNLLPSPRQLKRRPGTFRAPRRMALLLDPDTAEARSIAARLGAGTREAGFGLFFPGAGQNSGRKPRPTETNSIWFRRAELPEPAGEHYRIEITRTGIAVDYMAAAGLRAAVATLRQLLREFGRTLPCLRIEDWPDFPRRGVMLDISRGKVPSLETLMGLVDHLADFKINEFQLYLEHTFAYRGYESVWRGWGPLTGREIRKLDVRCRELGIDLVPNQNSFGHLRQWLEQPALRKLAEVAEPYESDDGDFVRHPSTLAPNHPGALPFLRGLYDELLPNFSSGLFNVGCDETWDLGRGRSKRLCEQKGQGRVYLDFLKKIHREVSGRGRRMMFWGDIILHHPKLIPELPKDSIALNWGYEANHPFDREAALFSRAKLPFYVCPGTSTWMTLIGRHDNALANLRAAAKAGRRHGASGYLITDWGDGGHPQPLAVSYLPYLAGASLSWCSRSFDEASLVPVLDRDIFHAGRGGAAAAAVRLGLAHLKFGYGEPNSTPFGTTLAAPRSGSRELFCRHGLDNYRHIPERNVRAAQSEVLVQLARINRLKISEPRGRMLARELALAGRMAVESCSFMLWQQAVASGKSQTARRLAKEGIRSLVKLDRDFRAYWPARNKGTAQKSAMFLEWRMEDYRRGIAG